MKNQAIKKTYLNGQEIYGLIKDIKNPKSGILVRGIYTTCDHCGAHGVVNAVKFISSVKDHERNAVDTYMDLGFLEPDMGANNAGECVCPNCYEED